MVALAWGPQGLPDSAELSMIPLVLKKYVLNLFFDNYIYAIYMYMYATHTHTYGSPGAQSFGLCVDLNQPDEVNSPTHLRIGDQRSWLQE